MPYVTLGDDDVREPRKSSRRLFDILEHFRVSEKLIGLIIFERDYIPFGGVVPAAFGAGLHVHVELEPFSLRQLLSVPEVLFV